MKVMRVFMYFKFTLSTVALLIFISCSILTAIDFQGIRGHEIDIFRYAKVAAFALGSVICAIISYSLMADAVKDKAWLEREENRAA